MFKTISDQSLFYTTIDSIFIYSEPYNEMIYTQNFSNNYNERQATYLEIFELIQTERSQFTMGEWNIWKGNSNNYLLYLIREGDVYVGAWVNIDKLISPLNSVELGDSGEAIITTRNFTPITQTEVLNADGIKLEFDDESNLSALVGENGRYLVVNKPSSIANFNVLAIIPEETILQELPFFWRISTYISIGGLLFLLMFVFLMRKQFILPIYKIVHAMKELKNGNMDIRLQQGKSTTEFELMTDTFNKMISEISNLKINIYEKKLNLQRAELKHLQLQINPHFFLNTLNIIYNLATVKEFGLIQYMSKSLSNYFRFMFKSDSYFVSLKEEIEHTKNYLRIQQLRFPDSIFYNTEVNKELLKVQIPPLVIQSLVENSIKHAFDMEQPLEIDIRVREHVENSCIHIQICDTGKGFPREILPLLNKNEPMTNKKGEHIGIWNVKRRLELLFGENKAIIWFENGEANGAVVNLILPEKKD